MMTDELSWKSSQDAFQYASGTLPDAIREGGARRGKRIIIFCNREQRRQFFSPQADMSRNGKLTLLYSLESIKPPKVEKRLTTVPEL